MAEPLAHAFGQTFWWAVGLTALALIPAWFLPRRPPEPQSSETKARQSESTASSHAATSARASSGGAE